MLPEFIPLILLYVTKQDNPFLGPTANHYLLPHSQGERGRQVTPQMQKDPSETMTGF